MSQPSRAGYGEVFMMLPRRTFLTAALSAAAAPGTAARATRGALTAVTLIHGLPGREADLEAHLRSLTAPTRAESGCRAYDLYRSRTAPQEFMRFEVWDSAEALERHKRTPPLKASFERRQREGWTTEILTFDRADDDR
jgi:quinol monooxygenase YgiN